MEKAMLVVTRTAGESLMIGDNVIVTFLGMRGNELRIGIEAPRHVPVHRMEVYKRIQSKKAHGSGSDEPDIIKE
jgi:carbon storage regulator